MSGPAARLLADFAETFEDFPVGMSVVSCDGRVLRANAALCLLVDRPEAELLGTDVTELAVDGEAAAVTESLESLASGTEPARTDLFRYRRGDGGEVSVLVRRTPVRDDDGAIVLLLEQTVDQSRERRAERRLTAATARAEALVRLSGQLATDSGRDTRWVCDVAAEAVHDVVQGAVTVWLADPGGAPLLDAAAVRTDDPAAEAELRRLYAQAPPRSDTGYLGEACRSGQPLVLTDPFRDTPPADARFAPWLHAHPIRSLLLVPLVVSGRVLGVVGAARHADARGFDDDDVAFAVQVGRRLAGLLADAQLLAVHRSAARRERVVGEVTRRVEEAIDEPCRLLDVAVRAVTAELGGPCMVWMLEDDDVEHLGRGAVSHPDSELEQLLADHVFDLPSDSYVVLPRLLAEERVFMVGREQISAMTAQASVLSEHADRLAVESFYAVRLAARGAVIGLLVVSSVSQRLSTEDRQLVDVLADRLAIALDNASLLAAARSTRSRSRALVEHCSDMLLLADREGRITYASPAASRVFGGRLGETLMASVLPEDRPLVREAWSTALSRPGSHRAVDVRAVDVTGGVRWLSAAANNLLDDPTVDGVVLTVRDVTDEREASEGLSRRAGQHAALASIGAQALTASPGDLFWSVGATIAEVLGSATSGVLQRLDDRTWLVVGGTDHENYRHRDVRLSVSDTSALAVTARKGAPVVVDDYAVPSGDVDEPEVVEQYGLRSGVLAPVLVHGAIWGVVTAHSTEPGAFSGVDADFLSTTAAVLASALERAGFAERALQQATTDALTGLPNRVHLSQHLEQVLAAERPAALLLLDLDDFKDVNDSLGHGAGDTVLTQLARRLDLVVDGRGSLSRLGGDEFAVCLDLCSDLETAAAVADDVVRALEEPFALPGIDVRLTGSIGIALAPGHGAVPERVLQAADMAMYRAKHERSGWALFDSDLDSERSERLTLLAELRLALSAGQLELHYQPLVDMQTEQVVEVEALVRWNHPERGLLLPGAFLPMAEQTDLVHGLTRFVVRAAAQQARAWRARGWQGTVAVNVSALALRPPAVVAALREELLRGDGGLTVELTESALVDERAREAVETLASAGIACSVDDFGTGWSSLSYLRELPVSRLKLDRAFNRDVDRDERDAAIVGGVVTMAHALGLDVVAEGVETREVAVRLRELGVDVAQGWLYGRPQPASALRLA